jgi:hypothetical protein
MWVLTAQCNLTRLDVMNQLRLHPIKAALLLILDQMPQVISLILTS